MIFFIFVFTFFPLFLNASIFSEWEYSKASNALSKGEYLQSQETMRAMLVDNPERPDLLYDMGVASFKNKEYAQAAAYFKDATKMKNCSDLLKEQAFFNLGNACVELNELNDAVVHYEKVLELNEDNEYAKHNLDIVKKMLEEQKKQQEQNQDNNKNQDQKDKNKDQNQKDEQQNNKENNQGGDQQKDQQDSSKGDGGNQNESDSSDKDQDDKNSKGSSGQDKQDKKKPRERDKQKNQGNSDDDQSDANKQKNAAKPDAQDRSEKTSKNNSDQKEDKLDSKKSGKDKNESKNAQGSGAAPGKDDPKRNQQGLSLGQNEPELAPEDKWILQVMNRRENAEKKANKELIRANIDQKLGGQDEKNCW